MAAASFLAFIRGFRDRVTSSNRKVRRPAESFRQARKEIEATIGRPTGQRFREVERLPRTMPVQFKPKMPLAEHPREATAAYRFPAAVRRQTESAIDDRLDALGSLTPAPLPQQVEGEGLGVRGQHT